MTELELRIREIYDLVEPRKDFVYTAPEMLEVIKRYILKSEEDHEKEISLLEKDLHNEEDKNNDLQDEINSLNITIHELEQEISELEG
jgi:predicted  nucleic acid-binding Zn-ribbon protein